MKVIATADLHGYLPEIEPCDLLLIAGDVCPIEGSHEVGDQLAWLQRSFRPWLGAQPAAEIAWVAGNHDFGCEPEGFAEVADEFPGHYLCGNAIAVQGKLIYGIPWTPDLPKWAFSAEAEAWPSIGEAIPTETDILLMHSGPAGLGLDGGHPDWAAPKIGTEIRDRIKPELCVFGHIHEGFGELDLDGTRFANVAHTDDFFDPIHPPVCFEL
ncbi:MAG TPA: metallophosphoesterase [Solirubrobacterales bacterium]